MVKLPFLVLYSMFTYECVVAAALMTAPAEAFPQTHLQPWFDMLRVPLIRLGLQAEILDGREVAYFLAQHEGFAGDLKMLQARYHEFLHAPLLEERRRFPDRGLVNDFLAFNRAYRSDLCARLVLDPVHAEDLRNAIQETDQLYHVWDAIRDTRCDYYYVTVRRQALLLLKQLVGNESFYSGQLPPHVPVWRFSAN